MSLPSRLAQGYANFRAGRYESCLLYTSDADDE